MSAAHAKYPTDGWADEQAESGDQRGEPQGRERWAREVEEVGHGECVSTHFAVREKLSDIGDVGEIARLPQAVEEEGGDENARDGEEGLCNAEPSLREDRLLTFRAAAFFDSGEGGGE